LLDSLLQEFQERGETTNFSDFCTIVPKVKEYTHTHTGIASDPNQE